MQIKSYSFPIVSPIEIISLPTPITDCIAVRFNKVSFKFNDYNKRVLTISLQSLQTHNNNIFFKGSNINEPYSFIHFHDGSIASINYVNNQNTYDLNFERRNINSLDITTKIDGDYNSLLISQENPLFITLDFISV